MNENNEGDLSSDREEESLLARDAFYRALAVRSRRRVLGYLLEENESTIDELAEVPCGWETESGTMTSPERYDQLQQELYHTHLPVLADARLVSYDSEEGHVSVRELSEPVQDLVRRSLAAESR